MYGSWWEQVAMAKQMVRTLIPTHNSLLSHFSLIVLETFTVEHQSHVVRLRSSKRASLPMTTESFRRNRHKHHLR